MCSQGKPVLATIATVWMLSLFWGNGNAQERAPVPDAAAEANFTAGRYLCFVRDDWELGVPMLALGNDEPLKTVAVMATGPPRQEPHHSAGLGVGLIRALHPARC